MSVSESNEKNISFILFNSSGVVNQTIFSSSVRTMNWSSLAQGNYSYNVSVYDYAGNANHTAVRTMYLDTQSPSLSVAHPSDGASFGTNVSLSLNFSVSDSHLESCWYGIDGGVNVSLSLCLNLSFSISEGSHVLRMYANDSAGNMIGVSKSFNVQVGAPSIVISSPVTGAYVNASQIGFVYTASDIDLQSCELWGNFSGSFGLNQTNGSVVSGQESSFGLSLLDGAYLWHIRCNDTLANYGISSNSTVIVDTIYPIINVNQPLGTKTNRTNIAASFNVSDVHLASCWYSVLRGGVADIGNTSVGCTENVVFNVTVDADFMFYLYANDSAGNVNLSSSSFSVSTSSSSPGGSPGGGGSSGGSGGGGGGGGGAAVSSNLAKLEVAGFSAKVQRGKTSSENVLVSNTGRKFLNNCRLVFRDKERWFSSSDSNGIASGEKVEYAFSFSVPFEVVSDEYSIPYSVSCDEYQYNGTFSATVYTNPFEAQFVRYARKADELEVAYTLIEFSGVAHTVNVTYILKDLSEAVLSFGSVLVSLPAEDRSERQLVIPLPKDSFGEFFLELGFSDSETSVLLQEKVFLPSAGFGGLVISEGNGAVIRWIGFILVAGLLAFGVFRFMYRHHQRVSSVPPHRKRRLISFDSGSFK